MKKQGRLLVEKVFSGFCHKIFGATIKALFNEHKKVHENYGKSINILVDGKLVYTHEIFTYARFIAVFAATLFPLLAKQFY